MKPSFQFSPTNYIPAALADWLEEEALLSPVAPAPYWETETATLYHGETIAILRRLPPESVNCIVTSPPYWALRDYEADHQIGLEPTPEAFIARLVDVFIELHRILRETGTVWLVMGDTYATGLTAETGRKDVDRLGICGKSATKRWGGLRSQQAVNPGRDPKNLLLIPQRVALALQDTGLFYLRSELIWEKPNCMPESVKDRPTRSHEQIFLLTKSSRYFFNPDPLREDCRTGNGKAQGVVKGKRLGGRAQATTPVSGFGKRMIFNHPKGRNGRTVWRINAEQFHGNHPAPFPRELVRRCLLAGCPVGGTVLDPFVGSGTVPAVANEHGFHSISIDIHARHGSHYATLHYLHSLCSFIFNGIEQERRRAGFDAGLDQIRGLPTLIGFERENGKPILIKRALPDGRIIEKPKLKVTCRSLVIKIPFYKNCTEDAVDRFFEAPFYGLQHLEDIRERMLYQSIGMPEFEFRDEIQDGINELLAGIDSSEDPADAEGDKLLTNNTHNSVFPPAWKYRTAARDLVAVQNSHERRVEFGMLYSRYLGRAPTGQELEREYRSLGLSKAESESDQTSFRFDQLSRWLAQTFEPEKCRFGYGGYRTERDKTEALMARRVAGHRLGWSKGDRQRRISIDKLAALYWCMRHSQGKDWSTRFSRAQAKKALRETLKVGAHNAELAVMFRLLQRVELIRKQREACSQWYARSWTVRELS